MELPHAVDKSIVQQRLAEASSRILEKLESSRKRTDLHDGMERHDAASPQGRMGMERECDNNEKKEGSVRMVVGGRQQSLVIVSRDDSGMASNNANRGGMQIKCDYECVTVEEEYRADNSMPKIGEAELSSSGEETKVEEKEHAKISRTTFDESSPGEVSHNLCPTETKEAPSADNEKRRRDTAVLEEESKSPAPPASVRQPREGSSGGDRGETARVISEEEEEVLSEVRNERYVVETGTCAKKRISAAGTSTVTSIVSYSTEQWEMWADADSAASAFAARIEVGDKVNKALTEEEEEEEESNSANSAEEDEDEISPDLSSSSDDSEEEGTGGIHTGGDHYDEAGVKVTNAAAVSTDEEMRELAEANNDNDDNVNADGSGIVNGSSRERLVLSDEGQDKVIPFAAISTAPTNEEDTNGEGDGGLPSNTPRRDYAGYPFPGTPRSSSGNQSHHSYAESSLTMTPYSKASIDTDSMLLQAVEDMHDSADLLPSRPTTTDDDAKKVETEEKEAAGIDPVESVSGGQNLAYIEASKESLTLLIQTHDMPNNTSSQPIIATPGSSSPEGSEGGNIVVSIVDDDETPSCNSTHGSDSTLSVAGEKSACFGSVSSASHSYFWQLDKEKDASHDEESEASVLKVEERIIAPVANRVAEVMNDGANIATIAAENVAESIDDTDEGSATAVSIIEDDVNIGTLNPEIEKLYREGQISAEEYGQMEEAHHLLKRADEGDEESAAVHSVDDDDDCQKDVDAPGGDALVKLSDERADCPPRKDIDQKSSTLAIRTFATPSFPVLNSQTPPPEETNISRTNSFHSTEERNAEDEHVPPPSPVQLDEELNNKTDIAVLELEERSTDPVSTRVEDMNDAAPACDASSSTRKDAELSSEQKSAHAIRNVASSLFPMFNSQTSLPKGAELSKTNACCSPDGNGSFLSVDSSLSVAGEKRATGSYGSVTAAFSFWQLKEKKHVLHDDSVLKVEETRKTAPVANKVELVNSDGAVIATITSENVAESNEEGSAAAVSINDDESIGTLNPEIERLYSEGQISAEEYRQMKEAHHRLKQGHVGDDDKEGNASGEPESTTSVGHLDKECDAILDEDADAIASTSSSLDDDKAKGMTSRMPSGNESDGLSAMMTAAFDESISSLLENTDPEASPFISDCIPLPNDALPGSATMAQDSLPFSSASTGDQDIESGTRTTKDSSQYSPVSKAEASKRQTMEEHLASLPNNFRGIPDSVHITGEPAHLKDDDSLNVVYAPSKKHSSWFKLCTHEDKKMAVLFFGIAFVLVACAAVPLGLAVGGKDDEPIALAGRSDGTVSEEERLRNLAHSVSGSSINDNSTPQHAALQWMIEVDELPLPSASQRIVQRYVLALLYFATMSETSDSTASLNERTNECHWHGVRCQSNQIEHLKLGGDNLRGSLPSEIAKLGSLTYVDLHANSLTGSLPKSIGDLLALEHLDLSYNALSGEIPGSLGNLSNLEACRLDKNDFFGEVPMSMCLLREESLEVLSADCKGEEPEIDCACCTKCH